MIRIFPALSSIPAGQPFMRVLARGLLDAAGRDEISLSDVTVLLPTRRACRVLQDVFLELHGGDGALLLPRMQPLGDIDEDELSLSMMGRGAEELDIQPALEPLKRRVLLARLIAARPDFNQGYDQALALAEALGHLMDQIYTENLDMSDLKTLVPEDFADHWQVTLEFLQIISAAWPKILEENGVIDMADRRSRLIMALAQHWRDYPPQAPVIAAGTTGSIPATARLLGAIMAMPSGSVVLPGFDAGLDEESWAALDETHPQYGFKHLFSQLERCPSDVVLWPGVDCAGGRDVARVGLAREIMRPAVTSIRWADLKECAAQDVLSNAFENLSFYECENEREEAQVIALLLRGILEEPGKTACLVTPDRSLAARVVAACGRWGIDLDDSGGQSLLRTKLGQFILLVLNVCESDTAPRDILALCHHPFMRMGRDRAVYARALSALDQGLRGVRPAAGFEGLKTFIRHKERFDEALKEQALSLLEALEKDLAPLMRLLHKKDVSFVQFLRAHLKMCEFLASSEEMAGEAVLWSGPAGEAASEFFAGLLQHAPFVPDMDLPTYNATLKHFMQGVSVRAPYGTHPRLQILGQLEARMADADLVVLGGLNEGVWPPDSKADPWMSRPMRKEFGLPELERFTGLAAHDFVQGFCAAHAVLTRSRRIAGAPSVPSRWLQRLEAVMQARGVRNDALERYQALAWVRALDDAGGIFEPIQRPEPRPDFVHRPRKISITKFENWLKDPYSIYARYVLYLQKLEMVEKPIDHADRGHVLHDIFDRFIRSYQETLPDDVVGVLQDLSQDILSARAEDDAQWMFWQPRFARIAAWFADYEDKRRDDGVRPLRTEVDGRMVVHAEKGDFVLYGRADRIDVKADGRAAIIDYKSGGQYSEGKMLDGDLPQLLLEALILQDGGFDKIKAMDVCALLYLVLSGGRRPGDVKGMSEVASDILEDLRGKILAFINVFDNEETPYISLPRDSHVPRFNDYLHLSRVAEWSALDDADGEAA